MSQMSFVDEMKDKAGRLIPTAYTDIVTEATSDILLLPDMEKITFICDSANLKEENAVDVVRAVRRRIDNKNPKVQAFTVTLLDKLVKECGAIVHLEIAETKGLLRDLVNIAVKVPSRDGEREAKKSALTLILSMTIWFSAAAAANEKLKPLILLADDVRKLAGEKAFEGIEVETGVRLKRVAAPQQRAERNQESFQRAQQREYLRLQRMHQQQQAAASHPRVVAAIPVILPSDEEVSAMLDSCLLLAECLNTAESSGVPVIGDEIIAGIASEIRKQHRHVTILVSSGADVPNMEMLLSVVDSQSAVIERLADLISIQGRQLSEIAPVSADPPHQVPPTQPQQVQHQSRTSPQTTHAPPIHQPPAVEQGAATTASYNGAVDHRTSTRNRGGVRSAADVDDALEMQELPESGSIPTAPVPTMDDIFGDTSGAARAPPAGAPRGPAAFPAPSQSVDHTSSATADLTHTEAPVAAARGSLNADNDDFDSFLNDRLTKH